MALNPLDTHETATNVCNTSLRLDLPSDIDCNSQRLYSRRVSAPKFSTGSVKSKFGCFEKQHSHPPMNTHCDERGAFMNDFHKFNATADASSTTFESSAKAIADNSCFRVYKMAADGKLIAFHTHNANQIITKNLFLSPIVITAKNYELPKLLIREGSPIESFHSSDTQLETLAMRCDSPKSAVNTLTAMDSASASGPINLCDSRNMAKDKQPPDGGALSALLLESLNDRGTSSKRGFTKTELTHLRQLFGNGSTMRNQGTDTAAGTNFLDTVPLKYRRGFSNLNDACASSGGTSTRNTKQRSHSAREICLGSEAIEYNSIFPEGLFDSIMGQEWPDNDSADQADCSTRSTNKFGGSSATTEMSATSTNYSSNSIDTNYRSHGQSDSGEASQAQHWRVSPRGFDDKEVDDYDDTDNDVGENGGEDDDDDDSSDEYSFSNMAYDNSTCGELSGNPTFWNSTQFDTQTFQSDDSLFNINFDAIDDDVFEIDTLNNLLDTIDLSSPMSSEKSFFADDNEEEDGDDEEDDFENEGELEVESEEELDEDDVINLKAAIANECGSDDELLTASHERLLAFDAKLGTSPVSDFELKPIRIVKQSTVSALSVVDVTEVAPSVAPAIAELDEPVASGSSRCAECRKKLGIIMVMKCHCGKVFCAKHRYAEAHNCSFDFKGEGKKSIAKDNPLVVANKVAKI